MPRCHDHKFDPIAQTDYYGFQAIFAGVNHAERELAAPDSENRRREAAAIAAELARIEQRLDAHRAAGPGPIAMRRFGRWLTPRRNVERFAPVKARMVRLTILATADRIEPCLDEVEVYTAVPALVSDPPVNVALAIAGGKASASSEYPDAAIHKIAHLERRPPRQRPELDFAGAGEGECHDHLARARDDRPRRLGSRSRGGLPRPAGDRVLRRGGTRAGPLAGRRLVARSCAVRSECSGGPGRFRHGAGLTPDGRSRAGRVDRPADAASCPAIATGVDAQGLCRHVQPARADAPAGPR